VVDQLLDDFEVDVCLKQGEANFAQRLVNILFRERGLPTEAFKGALEFLLKILNHS